MLIFKGAQLAISIAHPLPSENELNWRKSPRLPLDQHKQQQAKPGKAQKQKPKEPRGKRPPRHQRIEQLYSSSPLSFEELDSSFSRRSTGGGGGGHHHSSSSSRAQRPSSRYDEMLNTSNGRETIQQGIPLEQISLSYVEDEFEDPIEVYVQQQHQRIVQEHQLRASTPIQSPNQRQYTKSHATIV